MTSVGLRWEELLMPLLQKYKLNITWGDQDLLNIIFHHNPGATAHTCFRFPVHRCVHPPCLFSAFETQVHNCHIKFNASPGSIRLFLECLLEFPCKWNYRPDHCIYGSNCASAEESGVYILHGNRGVYHDHKQPAFRAVYEAIRKVGTAPTAQGQLSLNWLMFAPQACSLSFGGGGVFFLLAISLAPLDEERSLKANFGNGLFKNWL